MEAPGGGQTAYPESVVAPAAGIPLGRVGWTPSPNPGVNVGPGEAEPTRERYRTCTGGCTSPLPRGLQGCLAGPVVSTLGRRLRPLSVDTHANVQRVQRYSASMGAPMCHYTTMRAMPRARRRGVAQSQVGAAALRRTVVERVEGDPAPFAWCKGGWSAMLR